MPFSCVPVKDGEQLTKFNSFSAHPRQARIGVSPEKHGGNQSAPEATAKTIFLVVTVP
jgi:hypothetical protein